MGRPTVWRATARPSRAVLKDKQFRAESNKQRLSLAPLDDREIQAVLERAYAAPRPIHDRAAVFSAELN
jgi:hypothetical protein